MRVEKYKKSFWGKPYYETPNQILLLSGITCFGLLVYGLLNETPFYYDGIYWCVQSAFIGSVADWFAVNALFRRPLGISLHTAIIPRKKDKLIATVVSLVEENLLSKERIISLISKVSWVDIIDNWLNSKNGRQMVQLILSKALLNIDNEQNREKLTAKITKELPQVKIEKYVYDYIAREDGAYIESYYVGLINKAQELAKSERAKAFIYEKIQAKIAEKSFIERMMIENALDFDSLSGVFQKQIVEFLVRALDDETSAYAILHNYYLENLAALNENGDFAKLIHNAYEEWLGELDIKTILDEKIFTMVEKYLVLDNNDISVAGRNLEGQLNKIWNEYKHQEEFINVLNNLFCNLVQALVNQFHTIIGGIITGVLSGLKESEFNDFIEDKVGEDLGWIRINGAVVGAIAGITIWIFLEFIYLPFLVQLGIQ